MFPMNTPHDRNNITDKHDRDGHWPEIALQWQQVGTPLRPSAEDIGIYTDVVREWIRYRGSPRVLLLGVTPEIYHMQWPEGTDILAVDHTQAMIDYVWPGPRQAALCTDWLSLELPENSRDIVLCDGGMHLLSYPHEQQRLVHILHGVLSDQGLCILRLFVPPSHRESPDTVLQDLVEGRISNLNVLKLRLGMSLLDTVAGGVELGKIWSAIQVIASDLEGLATKIGWPLEHMLAINTYRGSKERYYFVTIDQVTGMFCDNPGGFEVHRLHMPSYELGDQCPTIVLQRR